MPVFLFGVMTFVVPATASVPTRQYSAPASELKSQLDSQTVSFEDFRRQLSMPMLDPRPFSNEFYLREFAAEPAEFRHPHSKFSSLSNAASGLSKRVASLRRALDRMMP